MAESEPDPSKKRFARDPYRNLMAGAHKEKLLDAMNRRDERGITESLGDIAAWSDMPSRRWRSCLPLAAAGGLGAISGAVIYWLSRV
ncbi:hypothetical protein HY030_01630 [Candidatus Gottesmanbacteria bacterium]|nr:hypothetical protein [Candidatus Gottesmanbacteria bacterium]